MDYITDDDYSLQELKSILLYDNERLHLSNGYYDKSDQTFISLFCQMALDTNRISHHWEGSIRYIEGLRLEEQMISCLTPLCGNCLSEYKKRRGKSREQNNK